MAFKMKGFTPFTKINDDDKKVPTTPKISKLLNKDTKLVEKDFTTITGPKNFMDIIPKGTVLTINYDKKGNITKK